MMASSSNALMSITHIFCPKASFPVYGKGCGFSQHLQLLYAASVFQLFHIAIHTEIGKSARESFFRHPYETDV